MGSVNTTTVADLYKILYPNGVEPLLYDVSDGGKLFAWLPKQYDFVGQQWNVTVQINGTPGANDWAIALNEKGAPTLDTFVVTPTGEDYAHISISNKAIAASAQDKGALRQAMKVAVESAKYTIKRSMQSMLWGTGVGNMTVSGTISTNTFLCNPIQDSVRFEKGMKLRFAATGATSIGTARTNVTDLVVTGVNRTTGLITCDQTITTAIPGAVATDLVFRKGDSAPFMGVFGWCPKADVASRGTTLFTLDRSQDEARLAGTYVDGGGANMQDVVEDAIGLNHHTGGAANVLFLNTLDHTRFKKELSSYQVIDIPTSIAKMSMRAIVFESGEGPVAVLSDKDCPKGHALLTKRTAWLLRGLRNLPHLADEDGREFRMESGADNVTGWLRCWGNLGCYRPIDNTAIKW